MPSPEKVPKALAEKFAAITALTDDFCAQHLNDEYRQVIHSLVGTLARKRPSPLLKGKESIWAAAVVHAIGRINFLDDPAQTPHCKPTVIFEFFGVVESTGQTKSREIQKLLDVGPLSPEWTVPSPIRGAKTISVDSVAHRAYLFQPEYGPPPASDLGATAAPSGGRGGPRGPVVAAWLFAIHH